MYVSSGPITCTPTRPVSPPRCCPCWYEYMNATESPVFGIVTCTCHAVKSGRSAGSAQAASTHSETSCPNAKDCAIASTEAELSRAMPRSAVKPVRTCVAVWRSGAQKLHVRTRQYQPSMKSRGPSLWKPLCGVLVRATSSARALAVCLNRRHVRNRGSPAPRMSRPLEYIQSCWLVMRASSCAH